MVDANEENVSLVAEVLTDATIYKANLGDLAWGTEGWSDQEVQDSMSESIMYLVYYGGIVAGTVSLQWEDLRNWGDNVANAGYMHRLAVKDEFHGLGLGSQIVEQVMRTAANNGKDFLRLDCEESNKGLCAYYEKLGFVKVGIRHVPEYGDYVAALYEVSLSQSDL